MAMRLTFRYLTYPLYIPICLHRETGNSPDCEAGLKVQEYSWPRHLIRSYTGRGRGEEKQTDVFSIFSSDPPELDWTFMT